MIIKQYGDRSKDIQVLECLLTRSSISDHQRKCVDLEIRKLRAGIAGEKEAAYEIDFRLRESRNWAVIHDLRIEVKGRIAQIDHLICGRLLDFWVCETKHFAGGLAMNELGEFTAFYQNHPYGIPSPIEQNRRHLLVLQDAINRIELPTRLGMTLRPDLRSLVLVSKSARITRPRKAFDGVDSIVKADQFFTSLTNDESIGKLVKAVTPETLEGVARQIAALHSPVQVDWAAKFGICEDSAPVASGEPRAVEGSADSRYRCAGCTMPVAMKVARFCWFNKSRFGGKVYCRECQKTIHPSAGSELVDTSAK